MLSNNLLSEIRKILIGRSLFWFLLSGSALTTISVFGTLILQEETLGSAEGVASVSTQLISLWLALSLFIGMFGASYVGRDFATGAASRSVILGGGRAKYFYSKIFAGVVIGLIGGLVGAILSVLVGNLLMASMGKGFSISNEGWLVLLGVFAANFIAGVWGVMIGLIVNNAIVGIMTVLGLHVLVEPVLQTFAPEVGRFFMTNAMSSLVPDEANKALGLLDAPWAALVIMGWLIALGVVGYLVKTRRDLV